MKKRKRLPPQMRRKQIIDTAVELFYSMGYEGASLRDLAQKVGINKATIYHYFPSKENILFHIIDEVGLSLLEGLEKASQADDPMESLRNMVLFQIIYMRDNLERIKVLVEEQKSMGSELAECTKVVQSKILCLYEDVLDRAMKSGQARQMRLSTTAFCILGQINWLYHWYRPDGPIAIEQLAEDITSVLFQGISKD